MNPWWFGANGLGNPVGMERSACSALEGLLFSGSKNGLSDLVRESLSPGSASGKTSGLTPNAARNGSGYCARKGLPAGDAGWVMTRWFTAPCALGKTGLSAELALGRSGLGAELALGTAGVMPRLAPPRGRWSAVEICLVGEVPRISAPGGTAAPASSGRPRGGELMGDRSSHSLPASGSSHVPGANCESSPCQGGSGWADLTPLLGDAISTTMGGAQPSSPSDRRSRGGASDAEASEERLVTSEARRLTSAEERRLPSELARGVATLTNCSKPSKTPFLGLVGGGGRLEARREPEGESCVSESE
jgi:hypothetical protein